MTHTMLCIFLRALGRFFFILTLRHRGVTKIDAPYLSAERMFRSDLFTCVCAAERRQPRNLPHEIDSALGIISSLPHH